MTVVYKSRRFASVAASGMRNSVDSIERKQLLHPADDSAD